MTKRIKISYVAEKVMNSDTKTEDEKCSRGLKANSIYFANLWYKLCSWYEDKFIAVYIQDQGDHVTTASDTLEARDNTLSKLEENVRNAAYIHPGPMPPKGTPLPKDIRKILCGR